MFFIGCLCLLYIVPCSWIDAFYVRKKPFETRYRHMRFWSKHLLACFHCKIDVDQQIPMDLTGPILFVSNHQSIFDMIIQIAVFSTCFTFISKEENKKLPFVSSWSKSLELIYFNREDRKSAIHMLREAARQLKSGRNLLIFPEGTRSKDGTLLTLQAGSLQPAYMAKATIVVMVLQNSYQFKQVLLHHQSFALSLIKTYEYQDYKDIKIDVLCQQIQDAMEEERKKYQNFHEK